MSQLFLSTFLDQQLQYAESVLSSKKKEGKTTIIFPLSKLYYKENIFKENGKEKLPKVKSCDP